MLNKEIYLIWYIFANGCQNRYNAEGLKINWIMAGTNRGNITPGIEVSIVLKEDQRTGRLTTGVVQNILTSSQFHPHGIKVRLTNGMIGRVKEIRIKKE